MTFPDDVSLQNWKKVTRRNTVKLSDTQYKFLLPGHKADCFFEGNKIIIMGDHFGHHPLLHFNNYLASHDNLHPIASPLWLMANGNVPTQSFFILQLGLFFVSDIAGQSMQAGSTTVSLLPLFKQLVDGLLRLFSFTSERIRLFYKGFYMPDSHLLKIPPWPISLFYFRFLLLLSLFLACPIFLPFLLFLFFSLLLPLPTSFNRH